MSGKRSTIYSAASQPATQAATPYAHDREARTGAEWLAIHDQKSRLAIRAKAGKDWDGKAANDNINWPLAKALLAEGNKELLKYAIAYRRIYNSAKSEAVLGGGSVSLDDGFSLVRYIYENDSGGTIYKQTRQSKAANVDIPSVMKILPVSNDFGNHNQSSVPKPWNGDAAVNDMIDAKVRLADLQSKLGHLAEPLELAVVDGETLEAVGNSVGIANRAGAMGAGRALVHMGLVTLRDSIGTLTRKDLQ